MCRPLNGVVGLKPTYGLVSRHGVTSLSWSLGHVGPITRTVEDASLVLAALAGHAPRDPASLPLPPADYWLNKDQDLTALRMGVPNNHYLDHIDPDIEAAVRQANGRSRAPSAALRAGLAATLNSPDQTERRSQRHSPPGPLRDVQGGELADRRHPHQITARRAPTAASEPACALDRGESTPQPGHAA